MKKEGSNRHIEDKKSKNAHKKDKEKGLLKDVIKGLSPLHKAVELPGVVGGKVLSSVTNAPGAAGEKIWKLKDVAAPSLSVLSGEKTKGTKKKVHLKGKDKTADMSDDEIMKFLKEEMFYGEVLFRLMKRVNRLVLKDKGTIKKKDWLFCVIEYTKDKSQRVEVIKLASNFFSSKKSWALEEVRQIESQDNGSEAGFYVVYREKTYNFTCSSALERNELLFSFLNIFQERSKADVPITTSIDLMELKLLGGDFTIRDSTQKEGAPGVINEVKEIMSPMEEIELDKLLASYGSFGDVNELSNQLTKKLSDLDTQNIAGLIQAQTDITDLLKMLGDSQEQLEEINNWMNFYHRQIASMREYVNAINDNNMTSYNRNNNLLRRELAQIIEGIDLDPAIRYILESGDFEGKGVAEKTIQAAQALEKAFSHFGDLKPDVADMKAMKEQKEVLEGLKQTFTTRLTAFLKTLLNKVKSIAENNLDEKVKMDSILGGHELIYSRLNPHAPLLGFLKKMEPKTFDELFNVYVNAMKPLFTKEIRMVGSENKSRSLTSTIGMVGQTLMKTPSDFHRRARSISGMGKIISSASEESISERSGSSSDARKAATFDKAYLDSLSLILEVIVLESSFLSTIFESSSEMDRVLEDFFESATQELRGLVDAIEKINPIYEIYVLKEIKKTHGKAGASASNFFKNLLKTIEEAAKLSFNQHIDEEVTSIKNSEVSVVKCGILPPVKEFLQFIEDMETHAGGINEVLTEYVYPAYGKYLDGIFSWLETVGETDIKHKHVARFENYYHIKQELTNKGISFFEPYIKRAETFYQENIKEHAAVLINHYFDKLMEFSDQTDALLEKVQPEEVQFIQNKQNLQKILSTYTTSTFEKNIAKLYKHLQKDIAIEEKLFPEAWTELKEQLYFKYEHFESIVNQCYKNTTLGFSLGELTTILQDVERSVNDLRQSIK